VAAFPLLPVAEFPLTELPLAVADVAAVLAEGALEGMAEVGSVRLQLAHASSAKNAAAGRVFGCRARKCMTSPSF
jgi:hypothetical protein